jgi:hypothetical protein
MLLDVGFDILRLGCQLLDTVDGCQVINVTKFEPPIQLIIERL